MYWATTYLVKQAMRLRARWRAGGISPAGASQLQAGGRLPSHQTLVSGIQRGNVNLERKLGLPPTPAGMVPRGGYVERDPRTGALRASLKHHGSAQEAAHDIGYDYLNERMDPRIPSSMYPAVGALSHRHELDEIRSGFKSLKARPGQVIPQAQYEAATNPAGKDFPHWGTFPVAQEQTNFLGMDQGLQQAYREARAGDWARIPGG